MAIFDLKAVFDPLAAEFREGYTELRGILGDIREALDTQVELTQTTNRLLATLVEQGTRPATAKLPVSKSPSRGSAKP